MPHCSRLPLPSLPCSQAQHLECVPWPIRGAGDVQACLEHVLAAVRRQRHSLVVLDGVAGLALRTHTHSQQHHHQKQDGAAQQQELVLSGTGGSGGAAASVATWQGQGARGASGRSAAVASARSVGGALDLKVGAWLPGSCLYVGLHQSVT